MFHFSTDSDPRMTDFAELLGVFYIIDHWTLSTQPIQCIVVPLLVVVVCVCVGGGGGGGAIQGINKEYTSCIYLLI